MNRTDYLNLILDSYLDNRNYFHSNICKRFKIEKENYITFEEFFDRCNDIIFLLKKEHEERLYTIKSPHLIEIGSCKAELWEMKDEDDDTGRTEHLLDKIFLNEKSIRLIEIDANESILLFKFYRFKNIKREEYFSMIDILEMENGIKRAKKIIEIEIGNKSNDELLITNPEIKRNVKSKPLKLINYDLSLKEIVYEDIWEDLEKYLITKKNGINKNQYRILFETLKLKGYTKVEYYNISIMQMKLIILNYFKVHVNNDSLKKRPDINNIFKNLPEVKSIYKIST
ncbi:MAG: hypothetical protein ACOYOV_17770 [Bacteroidales bacterium]